MKGWLDLKTACGNLGLSERQLKRRINYMNLECNIKIDKRDLRMMGQGKIQVYFDEHNPICPRPRFKECI